MTASPLIEIDHISKSFDGGTNFAVRDITMAIKPGAFIAMVGASGSGKTTALKIINRLIEPDSGTVRIDGEATVNVDAPTLRRQIGYVIQSIGLFPHMSIAENIGITPRLLGWKTNDVAARVTELLDLVGLPRSYGSRFPDALSGGERQRIGVARAIAARPRIVLMDEPFGALDPVTRDGLGNAYRKLHDQLGLTSVMVTHDVQEAILLADRIAVLSAGQILASGTPQTLMADRSNADVATLMAMPKRQAERVRMRLEGHSEAGPNG